jgi:hypothetical protein
MRLKMPAENHGAALSRLEITVSATGNSPSAGMAPGLLHFSTNSLAADAGQPLFTEILLHP